MLKVYVAGKYSADNVVDVLKNIGRGRKVCAELFSKGYAPFCPWHNADFIIMNPEASRSLKTFYNYCIEWLLVSDVMLVISGKDIAEGVIAEIKIANENNIPIVHSLQELSRWNATRQLLQQAKEL